MTLPRLFSAVRTGITSSFQGMERCLLWFINSAFLRVYWNANFYCEYYKIIKESFFYVGWVWINPNKSGDGLLKHGSSINYQMKLTMVSLAALKYPILNHFFEILSSPSLGHPTKTLFEEKRTIQKKDQCTFNNTLARLPMILKVHKEKFYFLDDGFTLKRQQMCIERRF